MIGFKKAAKSSQERPKSTPRSHPWGTLLATPMPRNIKKKKKQESKDVPKIISKKTNYQQ
jgi:hypothetical protein